MDLSYDPTDEHAAWLAFAFFHADSQSIVSSLCLRVPQLKFFFTTSWIHAFEQALQSVNPSEILTGEEGDNLETSTRTFVKIKATTPVKSHPYSGAKLLCKISSHDNDEFEQLIQVKKVVGIIVPGVGVGWVPESSIVATRSVPTALDPNDQVKSNRCVTALTIDRIVKDGPTAMTDEHIASMLRLLALVGEPLEHLQLLDCRFDCDHLAQILVSCPNLKELNLSGHSITNIGPLLDAYTTGKCHIHTLSLSHPLLLTNEDDIIEELTVLCRQNQTIRRLRMHLISHRDVNVVVPKVNTAVAHKLAIVMSENRSLTFVQLATHTPNTFGIEIPHDVLPFDFSNCGQTSLPLVCKLAFLSVVHCLNLQHINEAEKGAWCRLDARVLSLIISFSGQAMARHVLRCHGHQIRDHRYGYSRMVLCASIVGSNSCVLVDPQSTCSSITMPVVEIRHW